MRFLFPAGEYMAKGIAQGKLGLKIRAVKHVVDTMQVAGFQNSVLGHFEQRADDPAIQALMSEPAKVVRPLPERHPEPAQGPHAPEPEHRAARAEAHEHRLDLVVRVVPRREHVQVAAHHLVEHQLVARVARQRLDRIAIARSRGERRLAPAHVQLDVGRHLEPGRRVACGERHLWRVGL